MSRLATVLAVLVSALIVAEAALATRF